MHRIGAVWFLSRCLLPCQVLIAMRYINGTRLDDRVVRTDWDAGFKEGRQYGRGKSGGQVRDEYRSDYDPGRGGYGKRAQLSQKGGVPTTQEGPKTS